MHGWFFQEHSVLSLLRRFDISNYTLIVPIDIISKMYLVVVCSKKSNLILTPMLRCCHCSDKLRPAPTNGCMHGHDTLTIKPWFVSKEKRDLLNPFQASWQQNVAGVCHLTDKVGLALTQIWGLKAVLLGTAARPALMFDGWDRFKIRLKKLGPCIKVTIVPRSSICLH